MSKQKKLSELHHISYEERKLIEDTLDLEHKYFDILWDLFTSNEFVNDLKTIEKEIQKQYKFLEKNWDLKNKLKIPAERLTRQYIYKNLSHLIKHIYPSPISADIAFITNDAVLNLDIKTLDIIGNKSDISNLQFENNQSSFINKNLDTNDNLPNSGIKVECILPKTYIYNNENPKIMLTYFLTIVYKDDSNSFELSRNNQLSTIQLKCLPNGITSSLFDYDIINNFKSYSYFKEKDGFRPIYLTDNEDEVDSKTREFAMENSSTYNIIEGRSKTGVFCQSKIHPYYRTPGISFFPVRRKKKTDVKGKYFLEAVKNGHTNRISNTTLLPRFDSKDAYWEGVKKFTLK